MTVRLHPPTLVDPLVGSPLGNNYDAGCCNQNRDIGMGTALATATGLMGLTYFRVPRPFTAATMAYYSGATAAGATPTLIKYALFTVAANGDLTRIATTASDTTLFSVVNTRYPKALTASVALVPNVTYATAVLVVTGAAAPTLAAAPGTFVTVPVSAQPPRRCGSIAAQTDINASYAAASVANFNAQYLAEILA